MSSEQESSSDLLSRVKDFIVNDDRNSLQRIYQVLRNKFDKLEFSADRVFKFKENLDRNFIAEGYIPKELYENKGNSSFIALRSQTNGNCLYSSTSLALVGSNSLVDDLRAMTCIELFLNAEYYGMNPLFRKVFSENQTVFSSIESILKFSASFSSVDTGKSGSHLVKEEAKHNCSSSEFSSFLCILGLSSVIKRSITLHYPDNSAQKYKVIFCNVVEPRDCVVQYPSVSILFCRHERLRPGIPFIPNHFVPLLKVDTKRKLSTTPDKKAVGMAFKRRKNSMFSFFERSKKKSSTSTNDIQIPSLSSSSTLDSLPKNVLPIATVECIHEVNDAGEKAAVPLPTECSSTLHKYDVGTYFATMNKNISSEALLDLIKNVYEPCKDFKFPLSPNNRTFRYDWLKNFPWLKYSTSLKGGFCLHCCLFKHTIEKKFNLTKNLVSQPVFAGCDAVSSFKRHESPNGLHAICSEKFYSFLNLMKGNTQPINILLDIIKKKNIENNKIVLLPIVDTIKFCGRMALPLRGHRDSSKFHPELGEYSHKNVGLFVELLNLRVRAGDMVLKNHLSKCPKTSTYISPTTQNTLINCCGEVITEEIISEVKKAKFYTIIADECSDCSNKEQLSLVLRYVDSNLNIREDFLRFVELDKGLTGKVLSDTIISCLENDLKLDLMDCRGQSYDGAGNMSGSKNGCCTHILRRNRKAIYTHCFSHRLNLAVMKSCSDQGIRNFLDTVGMITFFFNVSPKRQLCLEKHLDEHDLFDTSKKRKLKDVCKTRWVERIYALDTFQELLPVIASALEEMKYNPGSKYNGDTSTKADNYFHRVTSFDFLVKLVIVRIIFDYTLDTTILLQSRNNDISDGFELISTLKTKISEVQQNVDDFHDECYEKVLELANVFHTPESKPRSAPGKRQLYRANPPADNPSIYYRITVTKVIVDHLCEELKFRFADNNLVPYKGLFLIPKKLLSVNSPIWKDEFMDFARLYEDDFPNFLSLPAELDLWEIHWMNHAGDIPDNVINSLKALSYPGYENIKVALRILATLPITSCESERSFSAMKRMKTYARSAMGVDRMNGLAMLHIHQEINPSPEEIIRKFASKGLHRLELL